MRLPASVQKMGARALGESLRRRSIQRAEHGGGLLIDTDRAGLVALAVTHPQAAGLQVDVAQLKRQGL